MKCKAAVTPMQARRRWRRAHTRQMRRLKTRTFYRQLLIARSLSAEDYAAAMQWACRDLLALQSPGGTHCVFYTPKARSLRCKAAVTFEFPTRQPLTHRITSLEAGQPSTVAARAIREAKKALKPHSWCSLVVVLERLDADASEIVTNSDSGDERSDSEQVLGAAD